MRKTKQDDDAHTEPKAEAKQPKPWPWSGKTWAEPITQRIKELRSGFGPWASTSIR